MRCGMHDTTSHDTTLLDTAQYDLRVLHTSRLGVKLTACASASCFKGAEPRPPKHLVRDIIECRFPTTTLRKAASPWMEVTRRPPPASPQMEVARAPPHAEMTFLSVSREEGADAAPAAAPPVVEDAVVVEGL